MIDSSVMELFRIEVENQAAIIGQGLLDLEHGNYDSTLLESLMRAAHSIKGAARIVKLPVAVTLSHAMEDCFTALQRGVSLAPEAFEVLLRAADRFAEVARVAVPELPEWLETRAGDFATLASALRTHLDSPASHLPTPAKPPAPPTPESAQPNPPQPIPETPPPRPPGAPDSVSDKTLRINAKHLDRIVGLAAEALVETHRLPALTAALRRLRREQESLARILDEFHVHLGALRPDEQTLALLRTIQRRVHQSQTVLIAQEAQADRLSLRLNRLMRDIYREATSSRMRVLADGVAGLPRMVRDLAKELGKEVRLEVIGASTEIDRDVLESLTAPLNHLLRNAVDHAIEPPAERIAAGKPAAGTIWLEARHQGGMLAITVRDDGRGIDTAALREEVVRRGLVTAELGRKLSDSELFEFLFLPSFTLRRQLTEISGRGVGLDIVLSALQKVRGSIRTQSRHGVGTCFQMLLPLTLSVLRGIVVTIADEAYVFPLSRVDRVLHVSMADIRTLEGREYITVEGAAVGLISARQLLRIGTTAEAGEAFSVILVGDDPTRFGVVVDSLAGEMELVVQPIDPTLGKLRNIAAATLLENGAPALIFDVDDVIHSIEALIPDGKLHRTHPLALGSTRPRQRILVVDDSFTVREVERKLLENHGYLVDVAVDGMDGWNTLRGGAYDLIVTDVDMPRLNGIELVALIREDPLRKSLPVLIVSYKDREEDRQRGLAVGADYYLAKSSFQDDTLLSVVEDLIGKP